MLCTHVDVVALRLHWPPGNAVETDQQKIDFIEAAMDIGDPFIKVAPLDAAVESALGWLLQLAPDDVISDERP